MSTYTQILYQIVFSTKHRALTLSSDNRQRLFEYISGILKNKNCFVYQIGGVADHIHIITHLHPSVALSSLVKDIKLASTDYIKTNKLFPKFTGWQEGYGAFTYSIDAKARLIAYAKNQELHHQRLTFLEEYIDLLKESEVLFEEKYI